MSSTYQSLSNAQSPRDRRTPSRAEVIPLVCFICPKNSHFSDLSHLLTHISSKGHLHNQFQLTLSRDVDENAAVALREFNSWYEQNGISALLRARKTAREERGNQQRRSQPSLSLRGGRTVVSGRSSRGGRRSRGSSRTSTRHRDEIDEFNDDIIKYESEDDDDEVQAAHGHHSATHAPPYVWHSDSLYPSEPNQYSHNTGGQFQDHLDYEDDSSKYEPSELYSPFPPEGTPETVKDDTGALILKGVVYPGMAGFDSATEKDRRMRNQKKDPAVLLKLEANSELVTRVEEVLDTNLDYQRTRDVYDEPSIDGSGDENDTAVNKTRTKRRVNQAKSSHSSTKRRSSARSRQKTQPTARTRATRSSARKSRGPSLSTIPQSTMPTRRVTRSSANRQEQLPLHSHGIHPDISSLRDPEDEMNSDEGSELPHGIIGQCLMTPWQVFEPIFTLREEEVYDDSSLALRPGNPNAVFASPNHGFKKSPPPYSGKENNHFLIKSPSSSFNPYLHPSGNSIEPSSYNPLCPQPRDGFGYRLYSPYDEEPKSSTPSGFHPTNGSSTYDSTYIPGVAGTSYHRNQSGGDEYSL
ncbi:hypothetical protein HD806DRAFT_545269 [Xylariaceae sp. AK1471]|nr:hypothetical protein HD806DRAFT_545269 [Xylariaceae sp. AK1471]